MSLNVELEALTEEVLASSRNEREGVVDPGRLGLAVQPLTPEIAGRLGYDEDTEGVVIARVRTGSEAARRGLRRGLLITGINRLSVESLAEYEEAIAAIGPGEAFTLRVQTPGEKRLIAMRMPAAE
jgi:serine protease Do